MVYTMIELITAKKNVMASAYDLMSTQTVYDRSSAMLWMYFVIVGLLMAAILAVYNRFCLKKWS